MTFKPAAIAAFVALGGTAYSGLTHGASSVTLYGIVDMGLEVHTNAPDGNGGSKTVSGMRSGGLSNSRWGLRGVEDLGGGLTAIFQLESGFNVNSGMGDGRMFQRTAMVGLKGSFGQLSFGRQYTPSFSMFAPYMPGAYGVYEPIPRVTAVRADNAALYSGTFGAFNVGAYYSFRDFSAQSDFDQNVTGAYGAAIGWGVGKPYGIMMGYDRTEEPNGAVAPLLPRNADTDNIMIGGRAAFGKFGLLGGYRYRKIDRIGEPDIKSDFFTLGTKYQASPAVAFYLAYYHEKFKDAPAGYLGTTDDTWQQLSLFAKYSLSKRTDLYAVIGHSRKGPLNLGHVGDGGTAYRLAPGESHQTGGAIGLRHMF